MSKKVLTDYNKQFIAENYKQLGPRGCADALGVKYGTVYAYAQSHGINVNHLPMNKSILCVNTETI